MNCKRYFNSYFQVEPDRSGMLLFPLGFLEGSWSNAWHTERHLTKAEQLRMFHDCCVHGNLSTVLIVIAP